MRFTALLLCLSLSPSLNAHESRPAHLEIRQAPAGILAVNWTRPVRNQRVLPLHPIFPADCKVVGTVAPYPLQGLLHQRWTLDCGESPLPGRRIAVAGLKAGISDVLLRFQSQDGASHTALLNRKNPAFVLPEESASAPDSKPYYLRLGVEHILGGPDHLLFVLLLLLLLRGLGALIKTITAFTLGHSITLAASVLGWVHFPAAPVEALIALSIVLLARELLRGNEGSLTKRRPWLLAALFGLVHGLGFAGALAEIGLPETDIPMALLLFNVGVELGQLLFIILALLLIRLLQRLFVDGLAGLGLVTSYSAGGSAAFWLIERVVGF